MGDTTIRIMQGKPGSKLEGRLLVMTSGLGTSGQGALQAFGASGIGEKNGNDIWLLPPETTAETAAEMKSAILEALAGGAAPDPVAETPQKPAPAPDADAAQTPLSVKDPEPPIAGPGSSAGTAVAGDDIGFGYRTGMSNAERDRYRMPVPAGSVKVGDMLQTPNGPREVVFLSQNLHVDSWRHEDFRARFPHLGEIETDVDYQLAAWPVNPEDEPREDPEPS